MNPYGPSLGMRTPLLKAMDAVVTVPIKARAERPNHVPRLREGKHDHRFMVVYSEMKHVSLSLNFGSHFSKLFEIISKLLIKIIHVTLIFLMSIQK